MRSTGPIQLVFPALGAWFGPMIAMLGVGVVFSERAGVEEPPAARVAALLYGMALVSLGVLLTSSSLSLFLSGWRLARRRRRFPGAPWLWEEDWAAGHVLPERQDLPALGHLARFLVLASIPVLLAVPRFWNERAFGAVALLILVIAFTLAVLRASWRGRRIRKLGMSVFHPRALPAILGEDLQGTIRIPRRFATPPNVRLEITCFRTSSLNKKDSRVLWEAEIPVSRLDVRADDSGTLVPVLLRLPQDAEETLLGDPLESVTWTLGAVAESSEAHYEADFILPVFRTARISPRHDPSTFSS